MAVYGEPREVQIIPSVLPADFGRLKHLSSSSAVCASLLLPTTDPQKHLLADYYSHQTSEPHTYTYTCMRVQRTQPHAGKLGADCKALEDAGVDRIQFDVMDGNFGNSRVPHTYDNARIRTQEERTRGIIYTAHVLPACQSLLPAPHSPVPNISA